jgi:hypothetical protein
MAVCTGACESEAGQMYRKRVTRVPIFCVDWLAREPMTHAISVIRKARFARAQHAPCGFDANVESLNIKKAHEKPVRQLRTDKVFVYFT